MHEESVAVSSIPDQRGRGNREVYIVLKSEEECLSLIRRIHPNERMSDASALYYIPRSLFGGTVYVPDIEEEGVYSRDIFYKDIHGYLIPKIFVQAEMH